MRNFQNTNISLLSSTPHGGKSLASIVDYLARHISSRRVKILTFVFSTNSLRYSGHCKKLTPEYAAAAKILGEKNPPLYLAKVDATENNALAERFEVKGFPTLHWFV